MNRAELSGGRLTLQEAIPIPFIGEASVLTVAAEDWRDALDVYMQTNGNPGAELALVRVYALIGGARVEVSRGRVPYGADRQNQRGSSLVGRVRGVACERYEITIEREPRGDGSYDPAQKVIVTAALFGLAPTNTAEPLTALVFKPDGAASISGLPSRLFSVAAVNLWTSDGWLHFRDAESGAGDAVGANDPVLPPIYLPAKALGAASVDFSRSPLVFRRGILVAASASATQMIQDPSPFPYGSFQIAIEFD